MAAVPSIVYGLWGFFLLQPHAILVARWLSQYLGWIPIFKVDTDANAAIWQQSRYTSSVFIAGTGGGHDDDPLGHGRHASGFRPGADR